MYSTRCRMICLLIFLIGVGGAILCMQLDDDDVYVSNEPKVCRVAYCGRDALYPEWGRRWCAEHIVGDKMCNFTSSCGRSIPRSSVEIYCEQCRASWANIVNNN